MATRKKEISVVYPKDVETLRYDWGTIRMLSTPTLHGSNSMSFGIVDSKPGGSHELHNHTNESEIIYVVSGQAKLLTENKRPQKLKAGAMLYVPPGARHSTVNIGKGNLRVIIVYSPAGPEVGLRTMHGCRVIPASRSANTKKTRR